MKSVKIFIDQYDVYIWRSNSSSHLTVSGVYWSAFGAEFVV